MYNQGGLNINESGSGVGSILTDLVKQLGKKVLSHNIGS
jgi:hypothetical protein